MNTPVTLGQLEDLVYINSWLAPSIPCLSSIRGSLLKVTNTLKKSLKKKLDFKPSRKYPSKIPIDDIVAMKDLEQIINIFKKTLRVCADQTLSTIDSNNTLELYTFASDLVWSSVLVVNRIREDNDTKEFK
eukprot:snap_masked-scaffold_9-processed-gene-13.96-mRNA-1 protein AED:1.00 eAED:1.00 QI:0/-1/0/0/-1/1/1/0/130